VLLSEIPRRRKLVVKKLVQYLLYYKCLLSIYLHEKVDKYSVPFHNVFICKDEPHILFVRYLKKDRDVHNHFLQWIRKQYPSIRRRIKIDLIPGCSIKRNQAALFVPWLPDPLKERFPDCYQLALGLQAKCRKHKIPIINPVENLSNSIKSRALNIIRHVGIRTAKAVPVVNPLKFDPDKHQLKFPFFIRENHHHGGLNSFVSTATDLKKVPWGEFFNPIAMEFINVRSNDGYFRKYRYIMIGDLGVPRHLVISQNWCARVEDRVNSSTFREEELGYLKTIKDPNHEQLNKARQALGFDIVGFDYSYDHNGDLVVWEPNPSPTYWHMKYNERGDFNYQKPTMARLYKALLTFYLRKAQLNNVIAAEGLKIE